MTFSKLWKNGRFWFPMLGKQRVGDGAPGDPGDGVRGLDPSEGAARTRGGGDLGQVADELLELGEARREVRGPRERLALRGRGGG